MTLPDRHTWSILKAVVMEQRLFRWASIGAAHVWFRLVVVAYLIGRPTEHRIVFIIVGAALLVVEARDMMVLRSRGNISSPSLIRSAVMFCVESVFLVAVTVHFQRAGGPWYDCLLSLGAIGLLRSDLGGVLSHFLWDSYDTRTIGIELAEPRAESEELDDDAVARRMRYMLINRRALSTLFFLSASAMLVLPVLLFDWSARTFVVEAAALALLSLAQIPRRTSAFRSSRVPLPIGPLPRAVEIAAWSVGTPDGGIRSMDRKRVQFATMRVATEEVRGGIWELRIDFALRAECPPVVVTGCRILCYEQVVVRDGRPYYGHLPGSLRDAEMRSMTDPLLSRQGIALRFRKAFADDKPMRVIFGVVVEYAHDDGGGRGEWVSDGLYVFTYRRATWPVAGPRTAHLVVIDEAYVDQMLSMSAVVGDLESSVNGSEWLSDEDVARVLNAHERNPRFSELFFMRKNAESLRTLLCVHREAVTVR